MLSILTGFFSSLLENLVNIGVYLVDAIILTIVFNAMAPIIIKKFEISLPIDHISMWFVWGALILIFYVGKIIKIIIPTIIKNTTNIENNNKD